MWKGQLAAKTQCLYQLCRVLIEELLPQVDARQMVIIDMSSHPEARSFMPVGSHYILLENAPNWLKGHVIIHTDKLHKVDDVHTFLYQVSKRMFPEGLALVAWTRKDINLARGYMQAFNRRFSKVRLIHDGACNAVCLVGPRVEVEALSA